MAERIIEVASLSKTFHTYEHSTERGILAFFRRKQVQKHALNRVSLSIDRGEIVALLGKNGSGKSTLIKTLIGILHPDSGKVRVMGYEPWTERVRLAENIGVVLGAHGQLFWNLPAYDSFEFMRRLYGVPEAEYGERLEKMIDILNLRDVYKRQVRQLSLGEQMKCNFMASILHNPKLVFLDEPTIGVDLQSKLALRTAIFEMNKKYGTTFILTTHIVEDIAIADRIILLDKGAVRFDGSREKLERMFGSHRRVELKFAKPTSTDYGKYGRVVEKGDAFVVLEASKKALKGRAFLEALGDANVLDYKVSDPGLSFILGKLYKSIEKR